MGAALAGGLLAEDLDPEDLAISETEPSRAQLLGGLFPGVSVSDKVPQAESVIIAVKPYGALAAAREAVAAGASRVLSIAAGVSLASLEAACGEGVVVVRAMPNTPARVGKGATAICGGDTAQPADLDWAEVLLQGVGTVLRVTEPQLDAVTGLSGSGPAYLYLVAEALIDAGVVAGLPRTVSAELTRQLFAGAAALLSEDGRDPAALRADVTSPGGTTAAGLRALEARSTRSAVIEAVLASAARSQELGATYAT